MFTERIHLQHNSISALPVSWSVHVPSLERVNFLI
jgi:hypothetical protein